MIIVGRVARVNKLILEQVVKHCQNPCSYCEDWLGYPDLGIIEVKEATMCLSIKVFGIPFKMNLCEEHGLERLDLAREDGEEIRIEYF